MTSIAISEPAPDGPGHRPHVRLPRLRRRAHRPRPRQARRPGRHVTAEGITAAAFPADVLDHDGAHPGAQGRRRHVRRRSTSWSTPAGRHGVHRLTTPAQSDPSDIQREIDVQLYGAMAAARRSCPRCARPAPRDPALHRGRRLPRPLPDGRQRQRRRCGAAQLGGQPAQGTGRQRHPGRPRRHRRHARGDSIDPLPRAATPEAVASVYWELHTNRDEAEIVYKG